MILDTSRMLRFLVIGPIAAGVAPAWSATAFLDAGTTLNDFLILHVHAPTPHAHRTIARAGTGRQRLYRRQEDTQLSGHFAPGQSVRDMARYQLSTGEGLAPTGEPQTFRTADGKIVLTLIVN